MPDTWRLVNRDDVIPTVPRMMGYCHVGNALILGDKPGSPVSHERLWKDLSFLSCTLSRLERASLDSTRAFGWTSNRTDGLKLPYGFLAISHGEKEKHSWESLFVRKMDMMKQIENEEKLSSNFNLLLGSKPSFILLGSKPSVILQTASNLSTLFPYSCTSSPQQDHIIANNN